MRKIVYVLFLLFSLTSLSAKAIDSLQVAAAPKADPIYNVDNWKMSMFYFNKADTRIFPPKANGMGWTINFANPFSVGAFVLVLVAIYLIFGKRKQHKSELLG